MPIKFEIHVGRSVVRLPRFTAKDMQAFGVTGMNEMERRMSHGQDVTDNAAKPLTVKYARYKQRHGLPAIRDMHKTGFTLGNMQVKQATPTRVKVGFTDDRANRRMWINQAISPEFGLSPHDLAALNAVVREDFDDKVKELESKK